MRLRRLVPFWAAALCVALLVTSTADAKKPKTAKLEKAQVKDVFETPDGQYVVILKTDKAPARYLPIWIGETEAMAIRLRLDRHTPPRPLTLNLLESVLVTSKIKVIDIAIDDLKGGVFLGKVRLKQGARSWKIDARPSDAIGLAVGRGVPIMVSSRVLDEAAFDPDTIGEPDDEKKTDEKKDDPATENVTNYEETL